MVWPMGWVCHAVLAPGVKCTLAAARRDGSEGVATASMYTAPVNQSLGPAAVSMEFLVICMVTLRGRVRCSARGGWGLRGHAGPHHKRRDERVRSDPEPRREAAVRGRHLEALGELAGDPEPRAPAVARMRRPG